MTINRDIKLDANGERAVEAGGFVLVSEGEAALQRLKRRLSTQLGEWFAGTDKGIDFLGLMASRPVNEDRLRAELQRNAEDVQGVDEVSQVTVELDRLTRVVSWTLSARAGVGILTVAGEGLDIVASALRVLE